MSKDNPLVGRWRPPQPKQIVFGAPGVGKTYSARITREEATEEEDESRE